MELQTHVARLLAIAQTVRRLHRARFAALHRILACENEGSAQSASGGRNRETHVAHHQIRETRFLDTCEPNRPLEEQIIHATFAEVPQNVFLLQIRKAFPKNEGYMDQCRL